MSHPTAPPPRRRFQFGLRSLLLLMVVVSVLASALAGMLELSSSALPRGFYVAMAVGAPVAVLVAISLVRGLAGLFTRR